MKNTTKELESGKVWPLIFKLTIPNVIAQLITFLYNIIDRMYVSNIKETGMTALAALGICLPITLIISAFSNLIGLGGSPRATMHLGEKNEKAANNIFNTSIYLLFTISIFLSLIITIFPKEIVCLFGCPSASIEYATDYLRIYGMGSFFIIFAQGLNPFITAQGYSFTAMISILIGALINIALDPFFIYVLKMGVKGAALATVISQIISFFFILSFFFTKKSGFKINLKTKLNSKYIISILSLGLTPFIMTITECAIQIVFNINLKWATNDNGAYTAALTIMLSALQLISLPLNGLGYGMQPFVSYNYGAGNDVRLKEGIKDITIVAFIFALIVWSISMSFPHLYALMFSASEEVTKIVVKYTPLFLMGSIMFFVQMTLQNINVALGQGRCALILAVLRKVIILIPLCFILTHTIGFKGVYMSEGITDFVAGFITSIVIFITFPKAIKKRHDEVEASHI